MAVPTSYSRHHEDRLIPPSYYATFCSESSAPVQAVEEASVSFITLYDRRPSLIVLSRTIASSRGNPYIRIHCSGSFDESTNTYTLQSG